MGAVELRLSCVRGQPGAANRRIAVRPEIRPSRRQTQQQIHDGGGTRALMEALDSDRDAVVLGPFELLAVLGQGGMGRTYLARKLSLDGLGPELEAA